MNRKNFAPSFMQALGIWNIGLRKRGLIRVAFNPQQGVVASVGIRFGKDDHSIQLDKRPRPDWMSPDEYETYPELITIREIRIRVENKGFLTHEILIHTSLWDDVIYTTDDIAALFRRR